MASTARDVIRRALRRLGVVAAGQEPSAEEAADALVELNGMLENFRHEGIDYAHAALAIGDTLTIPDGLTMYVGDMLSERLSGEYGRTLSPSQAKEADTARRMLQAAYKTPTGAALDYAIWRPSDPKYRGFDNA